eukprot:g2113.t1
MASVVRNTELATGDDKRNATAVATKTAEGMDRDCTTGLLGDEMEPVLKGKYDDLSVGGTSCVDRACPNTLSCLLSLFPFAWAGGCQIVNENESAVNLHWGQLSSVITEPGIYCLNPCGLQTFKQSLKQVSLDLKKVKVIDKKGNPLLLSAIVVYRIENPMKASLEVQNSRSYISSMGEAVLKQIAALYPYESTDDGVPSLKTEATHIARIMVQRLQLKTHACGAKILDFALTDLSYAPEIAQAMLVRQQAEALIDARTMIVQGAVDIAYSAAKQLNDRGVTMDSHEKSKMVSNIMCIICGDANLECVKLRAKITEIDRRLGGESLDEDVQDEMKKDRKAAQDRLDSLIALSARGSTQKKAGDRPTKFRRKLYIPIKEYPNYNFIGLILGPRGRTQKKMEQETGCKIAIRGRGSNKDGKKKLAGQDEDDLHVLITGTDESKVSKTESMVADLLVPIDDDKNQHKQNQLRELALINGTLKEDNFCHICGEKGHRQFECPNRHKSVAHKFKEIRCGICGGIGHLTRDCKGKNVPQQLEMDKEYLNFMAELGERVAGAEMVPKTCKVIPAPHRAGSNSNVTVPAPSSTRPVPPGVRVVTSSANGGARRAVPPGVRVITSSTNVSVARAVPPGVRVVTSSTNGTVAGRIPPGVRVVTPNGDAAKPIPPGVRVLSSGAVPRMGAKPIPAGVRVLNPGGGRGLLPPPPPPPPAWMAHPPPPPGWRGGIPVGYPMRPPLPPSSTFPPTSSYRYDAPPPPPPPPKAAAPPSYRAPAPGGSYNAVPPPSELQLNSRYPPPYRR